MFRGKGISYLELILSQLEKKKEYRENSIMIKGNEYGKNVNIW